MEGIEGESHTIMTLIEEHGRTTLTMHMDFGTREARDGAVATGMTDGMGYSYGELDTLLASL